MSHMTEKRKSVWAWGQMPVSKAGRVVAVAVTLALIVGWIYFAERATAAPPQTQDRTTVARCMDDIGASCQTYAKKKSRQFKRGKLGNSKGIMPPRKVRRLIKAAAARRVARGFDCDICDFPAKATTCLADKLMFRTCEDAEEDLGYMKEEVKDVTIVCGGTGAIASYKGGWWGFGLGAAACMFERYASRATED